MIHAFVGGPCPVQGLLDSALVIAGSDEHVRQAARPEARRPGKVIQGHTKCQPAVIHRRLDEDVAEAQFLHLLVDADVGEHAARQRNVATRDVGHVLSDEVEQALFCKVLHGEGEILARESAET